MAVVLDARKSSPDHLRNYLNPDKNTSSTNDELANIISNVCSIEKFAESADRLRHVLNRKDVVKNML